jgi:hypothetical protein
MSDFGVTAEPIGNSRVRKGALAPKKRAGIGAQPLDGTTKRKSHLLGSFRHTTESMGQPAATPLLKTRKHG